MIRSLRLGIAFSVAVFVIVAPSAAEAEAPADAMCPPAVPKLIALNDAARGGDRAKIIAAVKGVADAYLSCLVEAKAGDTKAATAALRDARSLADDILNSRPRSRYAGAAREIRNAAEAELAKLDSDRPWPPNR